LTVIISNVENVLCSIHSLRSAIIIVFHVTRALAAVTMFYYICTDWTGLGVDEGFRLTFKLILIYGCLMRIIPLFFYRTSYLVDTDAKGAGALSFFVPPT
jgi:hypothetical protein